MVSPLVLYVNVISTYLTEHCFCRKSRICCRSVGLAAHLALRGACSQLSTTGLEPTSPRSPLPRRHWCCRSTRPTQISSPSSTSSGTSKRFLSTRCRRSPLPLFAKVVKVVKVSRDSAGPELHTGLGWPPGDAGQISASCSITTSSGHCELGGVCRIHQHLRPRAIANQREPQISVAAACANALDRAELCGCVWLWHLRR